MTVTSTNIGIAATNATNAPAKPLRRRRIRCMKPSRGRRSNFGKESISAAGLSVAVAQQESESNWPWPEDETRAESTDGTHS